MREFGQILRELERITNNPKKMLYNVIQSERIQQNPKNKLIIRFRKNTRESSQIQTKPEESERIPINPEEFEITPKNTRKYGQTPRG